jgi:hypothetical protein
VAVRVTTDQRMDDDRRCRRRSDHLDLASLTWLRGSFDDEQSSRHPRGDLMSTTTVTWHPKLNSIAASLSGLILVAGTFVAGGAGVEGATAQEPPASNGAALSKTRITLLVDGCRHCPFELVQARTDPIRLWQSRWKNVRKGRVSFLVPTRRTHSMSINLNPTWNDSNAVANVVIRYGREHAGDRVGAIEARQKNRAAGCWAGTSRTSIQFTVHVRKFRIKDLEGNPGRAPRAWLAITRAWVPPMVLAKRGAIGNQDAFYCNR